ncbi:hypothetical protein KHA93_12780 [Bacillus sp. FJAT-49732]|uniref:Uncharacterized protein n=1 Tax=Lederbergia citrisecunda TaxID=2833583 RepID=A0A942TPH8_9BACI|nr:hypothetical protein [Lederbergia citrisecunda]MBS4200506.1 hypothetical protein [Lederbergia citrisecunda]
MAPIPVQASPILVRVAPIPVQESPILVQVPPIPVQAPSIPVQTFLAYLSPYYNQTYS